MNINWAFYAIRLQINQKISKKRVRYRCLGLIPEPGLTTGFLHSGDKHQYSSAR